MEYIKLNSFSFRVTKRIQVPVTIPFILNGTPKVVGMLDGKPIYGYLDRYVDFSVVSYAKTEDVAISKIIEKFGTDIVKIQRV